MLSQIFILTVMLASLSTAHAEMVTRTTPLTTEITRIYLSGSGELHVTQGEDEYIKLTAPAKLMPRVEARVKGGSLYLGMHAKRSQGLQQRGHPVRFDVQLKQIDAIRLWGSASAWLGNLQADHLKVVAAGTNKVIAQSLKAWEMDLWLAGNCEFRGERIETGDMGMKVSGSGRIGIADLLSPSVEISIAGSSEVTLNSLSTAKLKTEIAGSAKLNLKGKVDEQELDVAGSGDYQAPGLISNAANIDVMGSGDVNVNVRHKLTAELSRGADLVYHGRPGLDVEVNGQGRYRKVASGD